MFLAGTVVVICRYLKAVPLEAGTFERCFKQYKRGHAIETNVERNRKGHFNSA